jgi:phage shock protein PspC (stress-responsive transcriptional regulator)
MQTIKPSLFARDDTFFGVCQGLGEDLGVNPLWFRLGFALAIFFSPVGTIAAYTAFGAAVLAGRLLFPVTRGGVEPVAAVPNVTDKRAAVAGNDDVAIDRAIAA